MKFFFYLLLTLSVLFPLTSLSQIQYKVNPLNNDVTSFEGKLEFSKSTTYDIDMEIYSRPIDAKSLLKIVTNDEGAGLLHIFITHKTTFEVVSCRKEGTFLKFTLKNTNGLRLKAFLELEGKYIKSFWLENPSNHTSMIFHD